MRAPIATAWLTAAFLSMAGCQPKPPEFTEQDAITAKGMFDATVRNIRAGDWVTWSKQFAQDAVLQPPNAKPVKGRVAILAWGQAFPRVESLTFTNVHVSGEGNMAWGTSDYALKIQGAPADSGKQLVVFQRGADGAWTIPAVSFSSDLPMPAPAAAPARRH